MAIFLKTIIIICLVLTVHGGFKKRVEKSECPAVHSSKLFDLQQILGSWYVIEYYANSEELEIYRCMRTIFSLSQNDVEISMNFTFSFVDDPDNEQLFGNITWRIPELKRPSHWVHAEDIYEGVYNTYILDIDVDGEKSWVLLLHCAEKSGTSYYLSSFILGRQSHLPPNVISFLRDKLPRYDVDLEYMFPMEQNNCAPAILPLFYHANEVKSQSKHPLKHSNNWNRRDDNTTGFN